MATVVEDLQRRERVRGRKAAYETAGPRQLAEQPSKAAERPVVLNKDWAQLVQHLESRLNMMRAWRFSWVQHYAILESYLLPRRGVFINPSMPTANQMVRGLPINQNIVDPTGTQAMRICAAGLNSGLVSSSRPWFKIKPAMMDRIEVDEEAEAWFAEVEQRIYQVMSHSNFYDSCTQMFEDLTVFGTAPVIIYEDEEDIIRCYVPCPGEYFLSSSSANRVESFYRQFVMTVGAIVEMFGLENCPPDVQQLWRTKGGSLETEMLVAHAIEPNFPLEGADGDVGVIRGGFTWREAYWIWGKMTDRPLSLRGFLDQPHVCPRWAVTSNDAYGRSVGMDVLPDIMQLQVESRRKAEAIEKMVRPPLLASIELKNEPSSILPGHVTYVSQLGADKGMRPIYQVNPQIREMMEDLKEVQERIRRGFFNDLFLMMAETTKEQTAYEVAEKRNEKMQVLGPVIERFQNEMASPAIKRIYRIMERKQILPPLPPSLKGIPLGIEYVSMLSIAQKGAETAGLERLLAQVGSMAGIYPEAKFSLNPVEYLREYRQDLSVHPRVLNSKSTIAMMMAQHEQQMRDAAAGEAAAGAVEGAKTMSETDVGGGISALQLAMGGGRPQGGQ